MIWNFLDDRMMAEMTGPLRTAPPSRSWNICQPNSGKKVTTNK
jgi:hypothetical protein